VDKDVLDMEIKPGGAGCWMRGKERSRGIGVAVSCEVIRDVYE